MLTLLGSFLGFLGSLIPEFFRQFQDKRDKMHELEIYKMQLEQQKQGDAQKLAAINTQANITEMQSLYKTYYSGNAHADFLNGIVRPVIALGFFMLYCLLKIMSYNYMPNLEGAPFIVLYQALWTGEDAAIFAGIISFYFGNRAMNRQKGK